MRKITALRCFERVKRAGGIILSATLKIILGFLAGALIGLIILLFGLGAVCHALFEFNQKHCERRKPDYPEWAPSEWSKKSLPSAGTWIN